MAPDLHAPAEYFKHPVRLATTETERSDPPMMVPDGSNGDEAPGSTTKPLPLSVVTHFSVVPALTQKSEFPFAFGMLGVADAASAVLFTSTVQGVEADPQVLAAVHICAGFDSAQTSLVFLDWAVAWPNNASRVKQNVVQQIATLRGIFIMHLVVT